MKTIAVTGCSGFLGRHLLDELRKTWDPRRELVLMDRVAPSACAVGRFIATDFGEPRSVLLAVERVRPDVVYHLAGRTPPAPIADLYRVNTLGTVSLIQALERIGKRVRVVLVGSAAEYGPVPVERLPVREDAACRPADAYGLSKWFATRAGQLARPPVEVVAARVFNPIGPGMPATQALGRFARLLSAPTSGPLVLRLGDLSVRRDFIDARDVARALIALAEHARAGQVYNVGTGRSHGIGEGLDVLVRLSGRDVRVESLEENSFPFRGPRDSRADIERTTTEIPWRPKVSFERSLADAWDELTRKEDRAGTRAVAHKAEDHVPRRSLVGPVPRQARVLGSQ